MTAQLGPGLGPKRSLRHVQLVGDGVDIAPPETSKDNAADTAGLPDVADGRADLSRRCSVLTAIIASLLM